MTAPYAVLSPYLIPPQMAANKAVNVGDGFILRAIERLVGRFAPALTFSPRATPSPEAVRLMAGTPGVILAGANQLHDGFTPWPGLTVGEIRELGLRLIPFGVGLHGVPDKLTSFSPETRAVIEEIHRRVEFSSWRCPQTVAALARETPHLASQFLMTGCPVAYGEAVLEGARFHDAEGSVAVTATDREDFWERETAVIDFVAGRFPRARRFLVLHQDFLSLGPKWLRGVDPAQSPAALREYAAKRGYEIVVPGSADQALAFYGPVDLHIGSRLHAHLHFLSSNKRSFLMPVDGRAEGLALAYGFPLSRPDAIEQDLGVDFEPVREKIREGFTTMRRFIDSLEPAGRRIRAGG